MIDLVKFWTECDLTTPPYIHPQDKLLIESPGTKKTLLASHNAFLKHRTFGDSTDTSLHLSLLPVPYQGNLAEADIFIVLLNPGLGFGDYQTQEDSGHATQLRKIIAQDFDDVEYPFLSLNPNFARSGGFNWWQGKLKGVVRIVAEKYCEGRYGQALHLLSQRLAAIEMFPYHSRSFNASGLMNALPSVSAARKFVQGLIPRAKRKEISIIVTRAIKVVGIDDFALVNHDPKLVRSASLGPTTLGGNAILEQLSRRGPRNAGRPDARG